jgi:low affinity Fe/Cu permease
VRRMADDEHIEMPSEVSEATGFFDRFAEKGSQIASRAVFFALCVALVIIWAPSYFLVKKMDTWQLIINTSTTIITFLMVALLQNSQTRTDLATQHKLNAIADGLADLMDHFLTGDGESTLEQDMVELTKAVGLEQHESTSHNSSKSGTSKSGSNGRSNGTKPTASATKTTAKKTTKGAAAKRSAAAPRKRQRT